MEEMEITDEIKTIHISTGLITITDFIYIRKKIKRNKTMGGEYGI